MTPDDPPAPRATDTRASNAGAPSTPETGASTANARVDADPAPAADPVPRTYVVLVKQVPKDAHWKVDANSGTLRREGMETATNPDDLHALEAALQLRARTGGTVIVLTMGPPQAEKTLREGLAMGADRAVLVSDPRFAAADTLMTTHVLVLALQQLAREGHPVDVLLSGVGSIDGNTNQVPVQVSQALGLPLLVKVREMEARAGAFWGRRNFGHEYQEFECDYPVMLGVDKFWNKPRIPSLLGIRKAYRKTLLRWDARVLACPAGFACRDRSPTLVWKVYPVAHRRKKEILHGPCAEKTNKIRQILESEHVLQKRV